MSKQDKMTFAKKYGLEGQGHPIRIDPQTASFVKRIFKKGDDVLESGREWARTTNWRFRR